MPSSIAASELGAGAEIAGPALIQEHGTTTVLFENDTCTVAPTGEMIITVGAADECSASAARSLSPQVGRGTVRAVRRCVSMTAQLDTVTLEVIRNALPAVANEMAADLQRTSYNMMIYEVRDYCTALLDTKGELISQNVGGVSHFVADLGVIVTDGMQRYGADGFKPGDVIITNHQAVAGQHLNNVVIYMPYFYQGELLMFSMVRAHWIDVGGTSTGFGAGATVADPWLEGLQLDQLKIYEEGKLNETLYRVIKDNIRFPESSLGDMKSQMAACRLGGAPARRAVRQIRPRHACSPRSTASSTRPSASAATWSPQLPDGVYEASSLDRRRRRAQGRGGADPRQGHGRSRGDMTIDLSGCSAERKAAINSRTYAGARVAYKALTGPLDPVNEGSFRALDVIIPEGNIMMARFPAPMAGWSAHRADRGRLPSSRRWPRRCRTACRPAHHGAARRRGGVLRHPSQDQAPLRGAEHRGRRLGRPAVRGRRIRHRLGVPGRRAQRLDRGHRAEMPGGGREPRTAAGFLRRRKIPRRPRHRHAGEEPGRGQVEFRDAPAQQAPALGHLGRHAGRAGRLSAAAARRERRSR